MRQEGRAADRFCALGLVAALWLAGCGQGNFFADDTVAGVPVSNQPPVTGFELYHAFGDSITYGYTLPNQTYAYVSLASVYNSIPLSDRAISGDQACDVPARQIFANSDSPALTSAGLYSLMIGTNDVDVRGTGAAEATFNLCDQAAIAWLATPLEAKMLATSAGVVTAGTVSIETANNWNALFTNAAGSAITFTVQRAYAAPLYLWYRILDGNAGTFTCSLDHVLLGQYQTAPSASIQTQNGTTSSLGLIRFPAVSAGLHALQCVQTSAGASGMGLVAVGGPPTAGTHGLPRVMVGLIPLQLNGQHAAGIAVYDVDIRANIATFAQDGLDVEVFDPTTYMSGTTADLSDALHPNVLGHQEIFRALQDALK